MITTLSQICRHLSVAGCVAAGLTLGVMATGCSSDDHAPIFQPTLPATGGDCVRSIEHQGSMMASYDWTFHYDGTRLVQAQGTMRDAATPVIWATARRGSASPTSPARPLTYSSTARATLTA